MDRMRAVVAVAVVVVAALAVVLAVVKDVPLGSSHTAVTVAVEGPLLMPLQIAGWRRQRMDRPCRRYRPYRSSPWRHGPHLHLRHLPVRLATLRMIRDRYWLPELVLFPMEP